MAPKAATQVPPELYKVSEAYKVNPLDKPIREIILQTPITVQEKVNIARSLRKNRHTEIYYVYQDPFVAWNFTKAREALEGRRVPKEVFVEALFKAKQNVNRVKLNFGNHIQVNVVLKNLENNLDKAYFDVDSVDPYVTIIDSKDSLLEKL